jgi:hypothetical protein
MPSIFFVSMKDLGLRRLLAVGTAGDFWSMKSGDPLTFLFRKSLAQNGTNRPTIGAHKSCTSVLDRLKILISKNEAPNCQLRMAALVVIYT